MTEPVPLTADHTRRFRFKPAEDWTPTECRVLLDAFDAQARELATKDKLFDNREAEYQDVLKGLEAELTRLRPIAKECEQIKAALMDVKPLAEFVRQWIERAAMEPKEAGREG